MLPPSLSQLPHSHSSLVGVQHCCSASSASIRGARSPRQPGGGYFGGRIFRAPPTAVRSLACSCTAELHSRHTGAILMSNIYHTEPATHGKVLLHTSFGDIDIELWGKECPKACRNFVQLAMEGVSERPLLRLCHDVLNTTQRESRADILLVAIDILYFHTRRNRAIVSLRWLVGQLRCPLHPQHTGSVQAVRCNPVASSQLQLK